MALETEAMWMSVLRQALVGSAFHAPLPRMLGEPRLLGPVLLLTALAAFALWSRRPRLATWTLLSFCLAALLLCGLPFIGWCVALVAVLPAFIASKRETRPRTGALMLLAAAPSVYAILCWLLLSHLILDDAIYAWRFAPRLTFDTARIGRWMIGAAIAAGVVSAASAVMRRRAICAVSIGIALYLAWTSVLSGFGLGWCAPWRDAGGAAPPDKAAVASYVRERTPWGRVFVCGYSGLAAKPCADEADEALFVPCLDLRIDVLREAYAGQDLFILVPKPEGPDALESCVWRYDDLYSHGAQRLLFAADFGEWRLYQVISPRRVADGGNYKRRNAHGGAASCRTTSGW